MIISIQTDHQTDIQFCLDHPENDIIDEKGFYLSGWIIEKLGAVSLITITLGGVNVGTFTEFTKRSDVQFIYSNHQNSLHSGFGKFVNDISIGEKELKIIATVKGKQYQVFSKMLKIVSKKSGDELGINNFVGSYHYRAFVGPPEKYDLVAANQFNVLTSLGLRENHHLLDIGCGSLRGGRLFIPYLLPNKYFGIEPEQWLIDEGIKNNIGLDMIRIKNPTFSNDRDFTLSIFKKQFDIILAQSIFSHASENQIRKCLSEIKKVMTPTGIFAATFFKGDTNYTGEQWVYPGCVNYTINHMESIINDYDLSCIPLKWGNHPNGQTWIAITRKENKNNILNI